MLIASSDVDHKSTDYKSQFTAITKQNVLFTLKSEKLKT